MDAKQKFTLVAGIGIMALVVGFLAAPSITLSANGPNDTSVHADYAFSGATAAELAGQADLIVRVRVVSSETRVIRQSVLLDADEEGKTVLREFSLPFTDSQMEVLEVYKGRAEDSITVSQTGALAGTVPVDVWPRHIEGNPIFTQGSEHVLFLMESPDRARPDRLVYGLINPFGRYEIRDGRLITPGDLMPQSEIIPAGLPTSLDELVEQIRQSAED